MQPMLFILYGYRMRKRIIVLILLTFFSNIIAYFILYKVINIFSFALIIELLYILTRRFYHSIKCTSIVEIRYSTFIFTRIVLIPLQNINYEVYDYSSLRSRNRLHLKIKYNNMNYELDSALFKEDDFDKIIYYLKQQN